jgi:hypothetical protein
VVAGSRVGREPGMQKSTRVLISRGIFCLILSDSGSYGGFLRDGTSGLSSISLASACRMDRQEEAWLFDRA